MYHLVILSNAFVNRWQYRVFRVATRSGLLAEACLALLLLPILRGMSVFRILGIQFEASVRYHVWLGTAMILFGTLHGGGTLLIWGIKHHLGDEVTLCDHFDHYFLFQFSSNICVYALLLTI